MKKTILMLFVILTSQTNAQITSIRVDGGSVTTKLSSSIAVNKNSSLLRDWVILNDEKCPVKLDNNVGVNATYDSYGRRYTFNSVGNIITPEPIVAYETHHVLYNVFGQHIKTLSNTEIEDINSSFALKSSWYASENQVSEYLFCVSYVAYVRTKSGSLWTYNPLFIQQELKKLQISYEENYKPKPKEEK